MRITADTSEKQNEHIRRFENQENMLLPPDFDYESINGLRLEARQKLTAMRRQTLVRQAEFPESRPQILRF